MTLSKKARIIIFSVAILSLLGGLGTFGVLYYQAVSQIEIEVNHIYITDYSVGGSIFNPTMDVDLEIHADISNPTSIAVEIEYVQFELYFDEVYFGEGQTSSFVATQTPFPMEIEVLLNDIGGEQYIQLADLIVWGNSKNVTIHITTIKVMTFSVEINLDIDVLITQSDIF